MKHFLEQTVCDFIKEHKTKESMTVAVMVSGGVDSMCLFHILNKYKEELNLNLIGVYVDFKDFPEHETTKQLVEKVASSYNVPLNVFKPTYQGYSKTAARDQMKSAGLSIESDLVLTGHHANDQIETFLFRVFRGAGIDGLSGMKSFSLYQNKPFGKPFLETFKDDIEEYVSEENDVVYLVDSTNNQSDSDRNYIRNNIIPVIAKRFDHTKILRSVNHIAEHKEVLENEFAVCMTNDLSTMSGTWKIDRFLYMSVLNRLAYIKYHLSKMYGYNLNSKSNLVLKNALAGDLTTLSVDLPGNIKVKRWKDSIIVIKKDLWFK